MGKIYKGDDLSKKKLDSQRDGSKYEEWEKKSREEKKKKK